MNKILFSFLFSIAIYLACSNYAHAGFACIDWDNSLSFENEDVLEQLNWQFNFGPPNADGSDPMVFADSDESGAPGVEDAILNLYWLNIPGAPVPSCLLP